MKNLFKYLAAFRVGEVLGKLGFVLVGALFAIKKIDLATILILSKIGIYSFVNALAIFAYNAWSGYEGDIGNDRLKNTVEIKKRYLGWATLSLFVVSFLIIVVHENSIKYTAFAIVACWVLYSWPKVNLKALPFGGVLVSFATEILLFHLSYLFFLPYSFRSVGISVYFALLVAAGHLIHELIDRQADQKQMLRTTAVFLGEQKTLWILKGLYFVAFVLLGFLFKIGYLTTTNALCFASAQIVSGVAFSQIKVYESQNLNKLRNFYIFCFFVAILLWIGIAFAK